MVVVEFLGIVLACLIFFGVPTALVVLLFDALFLDFALLDFLEERRDKMLHKRESKKKQVKEKKEERKLPSKAFRAGYVDMAYAISNNYISSHSFDFSIKNGPYLAEDTVELIAKRGKSLLQFDPATGRKSGEYLRGSNEDWQQYYAGGVRFLSDVEEARGKVVEGNRLAEIRRKGAKEMDRNIMTSIRELEKIRNQAFAVADDHAEFDKKMKEIR